MTLPLIPLLELSPAALSWSGLVDMSNLAASVSQCRVDGALYDMLRRFHVSNMILT